MFSKIIADIKAVKRNDPAARNVVETLLCHTPLHAIFLHRLAHPLYRIGFPIVPRLISVFARFFTGVEIHPGARIGRGFFIDHGTGTVIGETAEIGDDCVLFHNVTLGGTGKHGGKRHPTLEDNVYIGTGAVILGPVRIGRNSRVGAGSFIFMRDIPRNCTVVGAPGRIVRRDGRKTDLEPPPCSFAIPENTAIIRPIPESIDAAAQAHKGLV
jgi:serine O-acetyltransferase